MVKPTQDPIVTKAGARSLKKIVALDVRPRNTGFAVFDGPQLLDWGVKTHRKKGGDPGVTASKRIGGLLDLYVPALVVMRQRRTTKVAADRKALLSMMQRAKREALRRSIGLRVIPAQTVKQFYGRYECRNKLQVASALAAWYPELARQLPAKRSIWQSEDHRMTVFDAAATGVCFLGGVNGEPESR